MNVRVRLILSRETNKLKETTIKNKQTFHKRMFPATLDNHFAIVNYTRCQKLKSTPLHTNLAARNLFTYFFDRHTTLGNFSRKINKVYNACLFPGKN